MSDFRPPPRLLIELALEHPPRILIAADTFEDERRLLLALLHGGAPEELRDLLDDLELYIREAAA